VAGIPPIGFGQPSFRYSSSSLRSLDLTMLKGGVGLIFSDESGPYHALARTQMSEYVSMGGRTI